MPLAQEQENLNINKVEQIGEVGKAVETEIKKTSEQIEQTINENQPTETAENIERNKLENPEKPALSKEELEDLSDENLGIILGEKLAEALSKTETNIEKEPSINITIDKIVSNLSDLDVKDKQVADTIIKIALVASKKDISTYGWLLETLESRTAEARKNRPIM